MEKNDRVEEGLEEDCWIKATAEDLCLCCCVRGSLAVGSYPKCSVEGGGCSV